MLDIKDIRSNPEKVKLAIQQKNLKLDLDELLKTDSDVVRLSTELQELQAKRNANAKETSKAKDATARQAFIDLGKEIGQKIEEIKPQVEELKEKLQRLMYQVPNYPSELAPLGKDENDNVEIKIWGAKKTAAYFKDHVQLLEEGGWAEFERVSRVCGSRSYSLKGDMLLLELALHQYALNVLVDRGFQVVSAPALVREETLYGTGHFPDGREQVYHLPADNLYLSGTAEVQVNSFHSGEILEEKDLPMRYAGYSPCFRREAGSYGRDVRGLIRVHQFMKVEQYVLCKANLEESEKWHKTLLENAEFIVQQLEIPYRIVECCTGDMGVGKYRMYDIESWVPSEGKYRETHSCSALLDWQARRSKLRYRDSEGKVQHCYTLNNTALATPRFLVPFLENHQNEDGSIHIPKALRPYIGGKETLKARKG